MTSPRSPRGITTRALTCALLVALAAVPTGHARAADPLPLATLEAELPSAPSVRADALAIQAALEDVREEQDRSGLAYTYDASFGPEAVIVPYNVDEHVLRFQQNAGLRLPIEGSRTTQQLAVLSAEKRVQLARITMNENYRAHLFELRQAYVRFSNYQQRMELARSFLASENAERTQALALLRNGFWTQTEYLDYVTTLNTVRAQQDEDADLATSQLALIGSSLGRELPAFAPTQPQFFESCTPNRSLALESAMRVDSALAQLQALQVEVGEQLAKVRGSTIDADVTAHAGSATDINYRVSGYEVLAALDVSFPFHARDEERAKRAKYAAQLQSNALQQEQREAELTSTVDSLLQEIASDRVVLNEALALEAQRKQDVDIAVKARNTLKSERPGASFAEVHAKREEWYAASRAVYIDREQLLLRAGRLLELAPGACNGTYEAIPRFTLPQKAKRKRSRGAQPTVESPKSTVASPSPQNP